MLESFFWRVFLEGDAFFKFHRESQITVKSLPAGKEAQTRFQADEHQKREVIYARYESGTSFANAPADFETFKIPYAEAQTDRTHTKDKIKE